MKKKRFFLHCSLLLMALIFACAFLQTGCNNSGAQSVSNTKGTNELENWINVDITFMTKTNGELRDRSIRAIEEMLISSVAPFTKKYPNYYPSFTVTTMPFLDSLKYRVSVLHTGKDPKGGMMMLMSKDTTVHPPPCPPCGVCPACQHLMTYVGPHYGIEKIVVEEK